MDLKTLRVSKRLKQSELAEKIGCCASKIAKIEMIFDAGKVDEVLKVCDAKKIAEVLEIDWRELYDEADVGVDSVKNNEVRECCAD